MQKIFSKTFHPGEKWSGPIGRNRYLHFKALGPNANVSLLLYNLHDLTERYNMPDTTGNVLMSDNGRVLASITQDSLGWHDSISGWTTRMMTDEKYGKTSYQENRNDYYRAGDENFKVELIRNGLSTRDLVPCVNLFSKVFVKEDGSMHYDTDGNAPHGDGCPLDRVEYAESTRPDRNVSIGPHRARCVRGAASRSDGSLRTASSGKLSCL